LQPIEPAQNIDQNPECSATQKLDFLAKPSTMERKTWVVTVLKRYIAGKQLDFIHNFA
jgi:hypothetical protein